MTYKTILVHVDDTPYAPKRIRIAAELALANGAHLIGLALTDMSPYIYYVGGVFDISEPSLASQIEASRKSAEKALHNFHALAGRTGVSSIESRLEDGDAWVGFTLQARYCDLVVIGQPLAGSGGACRTEQPQADNGHTGGRGLQPCRPANTDWVECQHGGGTCRSRRDPAVAWRLTGRRRHGGAPCDVIIPGYLSDTFNNFFPLQVAHAADEVLEAHES